MRKGYWIICIQSYEIDGVEIPKGRMEFYTSTRPVLSSNWRKATDDEIKTMKTHKGNHYNLKNV